MKQTEPSDHYCVYALISPRDRVYIGHCKNLKKRWASPWLYNNTPKLKREIMQFGWRNFKKKVLAAGLTEAQAREIEYQMIRATGFDLNMINGTRGLLIEQLTLSGETMEVYRNFRQAQHITGINRSHIRECLNGTRHTAGGYRWRWKEQGCKDRVTAP